MRLFYSLRFGRWHAIGEPPGQCPRASDIALVLTAAHSSQQRGKHYLRAGVEYRHLGGQLVTISGNQFNFSSFTLCFQSGFRESSTQYEFYCASRDANQYWQCCAHHWQYLADGLKRYIVCDLE